MTHGLSIFAFVLACLVCLTVTDSPKRTFAELEAENSLLRQQLNDARRSSNVRSLHEAREKEDEEMAIGEPSHHGESSHHSGEHGEHHSNFNHLVMEIMPQFILSVAVIGFFMFGIGLLFVTNWRDADIRSCIYKMISTTVSIFGAAMVSKVTFDTFAFQIIPCPFPRGLGFTHGETTKEKQCGTAPQGAECLVGFSFFFLYYIGVNMIVVRCKEWQVFTISTIGGHLAAFSATAAFAHMQHLDKDMFEIGEHSWSCVVLLFAFVFFILIRWTSWKYRERHMPQEQVPKGYKPLDNQATAREVGMLGNDSNDQTICIACDRPKPPDIVQKGWSHCCRECKDTNGKNHSPQCEQTLKKIQSGQSEAPKIRPEWGEMVAEAEDEATALCLGFLILQHWYLVHSGVLLPVEGDLANHSHETRFALQGFEYQLACGLVAAAVVRSILYRRFELAQNPTWERITKSGQEYISMTLAWSVFRSGDWFWRNLFKDIFQAEDDQVSIHIIGRISNAFFISFVSAMMVLCIDFVIDNLNGEWSRAIEEATWKDQLRWFVKGKPPHLQLASLYVDLFRKQTKEEDTNFEDEAAKQKALRKTVEAPFRSLLVVLGFLVGICWEKAFSEANTVLSESYFELMDNEDVSKAFREHPVIGPMLQMIFHHPILAKWSMGWFTVGVVILAWMKYIAPLANLDEKGHNYLMIQECVSRAVNTSVTREHIFALCQAIGASGLRKPCTQCEERFAFGDYSTCCRKCTTSKGRDHDWDCESKNHMSGNQKRDFRRRKLRRSDLFKEDA